MNKAIGFGVATIIISLSSVFLFVFSLLLNRSIDFNTRQEELRDRGYHDAIVVAKEMGKYNFFQVFNADGTYFFVYGRKKTAAV